MYFSKWDSFSCLSKCPCAPLMPFLLLYFFSLLLWASAADQPGPEHPAPERRLQARRDPRRRRPGSDPAQGGQPHLHVLPGHSLHSLSNPVAVPLPRRPQPLPAGQPVDKLAQREDDGFIKTKIDIGNRSRGVDTYRICARSSYGWIRAANVCVYGQKTPQQNKKTNT